MEFPIGTEKIDYLVIGHLSRDLTPDGPQPGGTAAFAALTARAMGMKVGIITALGDDLSVEALGNIPLAGISTEVSTSFENIQTDTGRVQKVHAIAPNLSPYMVPNHWRQAPLVHFGPILHELDLALLRLFPQSEKFLTPQGFLRGIGPGGIVHTSDWPESRFVLEQMEAAVISEEDVQNMAYLIDEMAADVPVLVVTRGALGADVYQDGELTTVPAPLVNVVDPTGAGDIFAAAFFVHYFRTQDALESARLAVYLASQSVTRTGLAGIPTPEEIRQSAELVV